MNAWTFAIAGVLSLASRLALAGPIVSFAVTGGPTFTQNPDASTVPDQIEVFVGSAFTPAGGITANLFVAGYDGCDAAGLLGALSGSYIVVVQRGACSFGTKALNSSWVGALALVVVDNVAPSTLNGASIVGGPSIPSIFVTRDVGLTLAGLDRHQATLSISPGPPDSTAVAEPSSVIILSGGILCLALTVTRKRIAKVGRLGTLPSPASGRGFDRMGGSWVSRWSR